MIPPAHWWMRHESGPTEQRAPITPADAAILFGAGHSVTVERSPQRAFPIEEYAAAGCRVAEAGTWPQAPDEAVVIGLKEPAAEPGPLSGRHVFFGHAYKGQAGARNLLDRFAAGGGVLFDLEYLADEAGRRVAAFGYWAGYVGAALAVLRYHDRLAEPLHAMRRDDLNEALRTAPGPVPAAVVIGALGRSGVGARDALAVAGATVTAWDVDETRVLDRTALLTAHDLMVNTVLSTAPGDPFLTTEDVAEPRRRLRVVSDVTCDFTSDNNRLPIYDRPTTWAAPARRLHEEPPLNLIAIDNLPSLVPREASIAFSADLRPHLALLGGTAGEEAPVWQRCRQKFESARDRRAETVKGTHV